jgi:hypothetical protein
LGSAALKKHERATRKLDVVINKALIPYLSIVYPRMGESAADIK